MLLPQDQNNHEKKYDTNACFFFPFCSDNIFSMLHVRVCFAECEKLTGLSTRK